MHNTCAVLTNGNNIKLDQCTANLELGGSAQNCLSGGYPGAKLLAINVSDIIFFTLFAIFTLS